MENGKKWCIMSSIAISLKKTDTPQFLAQMNQIGKSFLNELKYCVSRTQFHGLNEHVV